VGGAGGEFDGVRRVRLDGGAVGGLVEVEDGGFGGGGAANPG